MNEQETQMTGNEKFDLIEKTIKDVQGNYSADRLIQDCADKLSLSVNEVKRILAEYDSDVLK